MYLTLVAGMLVFIHVPQSHFSQRAKNYFAAVTTYILFYLKPFK